MREDLLHFIWRTRRFDFENLQTTDKAPVQILQPGKYNTHAGPDFLNAKIKIGSTIWAGSVEMHLQASDWLKHGHQTDSSYDNVILHVVLTEDEKIQHRNGTHIPCLEMKERLPANILQTYQKLQHNAYWIPCQHLLHEVNALTKANWLDRLLVERLEMKTTYIANSLKHNKGNWEETFYQALARNFGVKINSAPMEMLAQRTPLKILLKNKNNLQQIEAILFGQSGLLPVAPQDAYPTALKNEYDYLKNKYQISPMPKAAWRFMRLRPANFPTIRIAQLAALLHRHGTLFAKMLELETTEQARDFFKVKIAPYWENHYIPDKPAPARRKQIGRSTVHLIFINTVAPFLFYYGQINQDKIRMDRALKFLEQLPAESNSIIKKWKTLGMNPENAGHSQSLLQLKNEYCQHQKCLQCAIGASILRK